jgi:segregation and condensation protein B
VRRRIPESDHDEELRLMSSTDEAIQPPIHSVEASGPIAPASPAELHAALEAIMLVVDEPAPAALLAAVLATPEALVVEALRSLQAAYDQDARGFDLREVAGGWRFYTRDAMASYVERFVLDGQAARLTQAALETLAVVAYRQPVSRTRVSAVRGVNVEGVMRTLVSRGLVEEAGSDHESGAVLYRTSPYFLERLGLRSLEELPNLANFLPESTTIDQLEDELSREG